jgi:voltage-gated potassium channel
MQGDSGAVKQVYIGASVFIGVVLMATLGYVLSGWSLMDSLYMVVITVFGVGYGEVNPISSVGGRVFTIGVIVGGNCAVVYLVGALVRVVTEGEVMKVLEEQKSSRDIEKLSNHTIICGYGRMGKMLARELHKEKRPFVIVDMEQARVDLAHRDGYLATVGDAGQEETLIKVHIDSAACLAAILPSDMINVFIVLTARTVRKDLRILARAEDPASELKLHQAGADEVILPVLSGAIQVAHRITRPSLLEIVHENNRFLREDLDQLGVEIKEEFIRENSRFVGKLLRDFTKNLGAASLVLAVSRDDGTAITKPADDMVLRSGDTVVYLRHGVGK